MIFPKRFYLQNPKYIAIHGTWISYQNKINEKNHISNLYFSLFFKKIILENKFFPLYLIAIKGNHYFPVFSRNDIS
jgi:hypothetical protein